ncbi:hypothetical protein AYO38_04030 [bacterium SCGC AG-212-C10]|nr:hypothetical protein AYO38_04030 [bacterium SCGC AG-212-C10]
MTTPMQLGGLLAELGSARLLRGERETVLTAIEHDSRRAGAGSLFVAVPGYRVDGHQFLAEVAGRGAAAVLVQADRPKEWSTLPEGPAIISVPDTRVALAEAAAWFYRHPGREMVVIGITGTDGKTTTSHFVSSMLEAAGALAGRLGTVDVQIAGNAGSMAARMTTPEATEVQGIMRQMADAACDYAVIESTSHGLALHRLDHVEYDVAAFTNITGDHLDFHGTFEAYRDAKGMLFSALDSSLDKGVPKVAIANADDPSANFMLGCSTNASNLRFGLDSTEAEVLARNVILRSDGSDFRLVTPRGMAEVSIRLPALFNVANALAAAAIGVALDLDVQTIARGLGANPGVPGRMERIVHGQPFEVIVDYAHTGDAVRKVLDVLREVCRGQLIVVVGAAGERDPGRRYGVARAAAAASDFAVFTNEDPRSEDPGDIVKEIGRHAESAGRTKGRDYLEIEDRREAIGVALARAREGDIVVICGKGHEQSIIVGDQSLPWDDREVVREELTKLNYR